MELRDVPGVHRISNHFFHFASSRLTTPDLYSADSHYLTAKD